MICLRGKYSTTQVPSRDEQTAASGTACMRCLAPELYLTSLNMGYEEVIDKLAHMKVRMGSLSFRYDMKLDEICKGHEMIMLHK